MPDLKRIRDRAVFYLSDEVAACAGMTLSELQQFAIGHYWPDEVQLRALARRMSLEKETR